MPTQATEEPFYYADGRKVRLRRSERLVAVRERNAAMTDGPGSGSAVAPAPAADVGGAVMPDGDRVLLDRDRRRLTIELNL